MTRRTQRNIISQISTIFTINIRPLDVFWSFIKNCTKFTLSRFAKFAAYPLVQPSISNTVSFPSIMVLTREFFHGFKTIRHFWSSFLKFMSKLNQFLVSCFCVATHITVVSRIYFGRRLEQNVSTFNTIYFNHIATI